MFPCDPSVHRACVPSQGDVSVPEVSLTRHLTEACYWWCCSGQDGVPIQRSTPPASLSFASIPLRCSPIPVSLHPGPQGLQPKPAHPSYGKKENVTSSVCSKKHCERIAGLKGVCWTYGLCRLVITNKGASLSECQQEQFNPSDY